MTDLPRGAAGTLSVEWRTYAGGPYANVTGVTITIIPLAGGTSILGPTSMGVTNPAVGINVYSWTPATNLPVGSYLVEWSGTDPELDTVGAAEIVTVSAGGALGGPYADAATLKRRASIPDAATRSDADITDALSSASDAINRWCGRQFGQLSTASERTFPVGPTGVDTDDFWTTDDLVVAGTAWTLDTYSLVPDNGIEDGVPGYPYRRLALPWTSGLSSWTTTAITVSARWGWAAVPAGIRQACLMLAADDLKSGDAPFGVAGFGDYVVRIRANPKVAEKLEPYIHPAKRLLAA